MANELKGIGADSTSAHRFTAYNAAGQVWDGTTFSNWQDVNFSSYGITATQLGTSGRYQGDSPSGSVVAYDLWLWTGTLGTSYRVFEDVIQTSGGGGGGGTGDTAVDHNTSGTDYLRVVDANSNGVDNVVLRAYLGTDYAAGTYNVLATAVTKSDGRWVSPMYLNSGFTYTIVTQATPRNPSGTASVSI